MSFVSRFLILTTLVVGPVAPAVLAESVPTIIVLDASGSMRERIKGESKMNIAKRAIRELVETLPDDASLGLVVYSHRKSNDCSDIEMLIVPGQLDKAGFVAAVDTIKPNGRTPLSGALEFTATALDYARRPANVILLSDGVETCGKDPCATIARLKSSANRLTVHAVAFDLSAREAKSFECIAAVTGGRFLQAADAASLRDALSVAVAETVVAGSAAAEPLPAELLTEATLQVPPMVPAGAEFAVNWTGPNNPGDYVTIVQKGTADDVFANFSYTRSGSPVPLTALIDPGDAEVRYVAGRSKKVLGRAAIKITATEVTLAAPDEATAGARVAVAWTGPDNVGDYVTVVPIATEDGGYAKYADTREGATLLIPVPMEVGEAEVRYMSGQSRRVLARRPIRIKAAEVTLAGPEQTVAGSRTEVTWTGPDNDGDFLTIVSQGAREDAYEGYENTRVGPVLKITAPVNPGAGEIRYVSGQDRRVLARRPITVVAAEVEMTAAAEVVAGAELAVTWSGPDNAGDYITIVPQGARDDAYEGYQNTIAGSPLRVRAPANPGPAEMRYISGPGRKVLARRPVVVKAAEITLFAADEIVAGAEVEITWTGPNNSGDYITVVQKTARDDSFANYKYTTMGSPMKVLTPVDAGAAEIRYISGTGRKVLARRELALKAPNVSLQAPAQAGPGTQVSVAWTGPNNPGDYITIVRQGAPEGRTERYALTARGSPASVGTPAVAGPAEVRYVTGQGARTLARVAIEIMPKP